MKIKIIPHKMIKTTGTLYKKCKGESCEACGVKTNLTVHHIFPQEAIKYYKIEEIPESLLSTLCQACHDEYETEANIIKNKLVKADPLAQYFDKAATYLHRLKHDKKMAKADKSNALEFLSLYTREFICESNLPKNLESFRTPLYKRYELNEVKKMWKNHYKSWLERSHMFLNAVYYVEI